MASREDAAVLVTINEEFVTSEQMNNCATSDHVGQAGQAAVPAPNATVDSVHSSSSDEDEPQDAAPAPPAGPEPQPEQSKPPKKAQENHHSVKNHRSKQKRAHTSDPQKKSASRPEPAAPAAAPSAPPAAPSAPVRAAPAQAPQNHSNASAPPAAVAKMPGAPPVATNGPKAPAFPHMEAVSRVLSLPVVESGVSMVSGVYSKVKNVNPVVQWSLGTAEGAVRSSLGRSLSWLGPFSGPISVVDALLCRGLDMVEYKVPIITLPPELLVTAGRDYMSSHVVAPVIRLTATNARLADTLAVRALDSADHYVDKYLPGDAATENGDAGYAGANLKGGAALQRADRLTRKLQRRITRRTLLEARALRKDTENTLQTLLFFAETLVKDPRAFVEQCCAVWSHLSETEPENQAPPETLEERLALLVREVARRVVHLANYTAASANKHTVSNAAHHVLKSVRVEGTKVMTFAQSQLERVHMKLVMGDVNAYTHLLLERLAHLLAGLRTSSQSMVQRFPHSGSNNVGIVN